MHRVRLAALVATTAIGVTPAAADERAFTIGTRPVWFVTGGLTTGGSLSAPRGAFVGGELSLVRLRERRFVGLYADALHDFGPDATYLTAGPELGLIRRSRLLPVAVGLDGGALLRFGDERALGATGRLFVTFAGAVGLFGRYAYLDTADAEHVVQVGLTLKFPLGPPFGPATRRR